MRGTGSTKLPAPGTSVDRAHVRLTRGDDGRVQLGADHVDELLLNLLRRRDVSEVLVGSVRSGLLVRVREHRLRRLQVRAEPVDVVHPRRRLDGLGVVLDQRERVRVLLQALHQAQHGRDVRRVSGGRHDAVELGGEAGGVEDDGGGVAPLHERDQQSDEERGHHDQEDGDGQGEQRARNERGDDVHRSLSEVRSRTSIVG